jgi:hypothetical protein
LKPIALACENQAMATKTEMPTEIVVLLETLRKLQRDAAEKDAKIAERDRMIAEQQAAIATLEFHRVELVPPATGCEIRCH